MIVTKKFHELMDSELANVTRESVHAVALGQLGERTDVEAEVSRLPGGEILAIFCNAPFFVAAVEFKGRRFNYVPELLGREGCWTEAADPTEEG